MYINNCLFLGIQFFHICTCKWFCSHTANSYFKQLAASYHSQKGNVKQLHEKLLSVLFFTLKPVFSLPERGELAFWFYWI